MSGKSEPWPIVEAPKFLVSEIFGPTFQGEGPLAGTKTMFVRFATCDYKCTMCDSMHAVDPRAVKKFAKPMTAFEIAQELIGKAHDSGTPWVTFSGGNPCLWDLSELVQLLNEAEIAVAVETQGTKIPRWLTSVQMVVVSPKGPGMGEKFSHDVLARFLQPFQDLYHAEKPIPLAFKFVIFSQQDIEFGIDVINWVAREVPGVINPAFLFMSLGNPYPPQLDPETLQYSQVINDDSSNDDLRLALLDSYRQLMEDVVMDKRITHVRFLPQLHVLAYGNKAGV